MNIIKKIICDIIQRNNNKPQYVPFYVDKTISSNTINSATLYNSEDQDFYICEHIIDCINAEKLKTYLLSIDKTSEANINVSDTNIKIYLRPKYIKKYLKKVLSEKKILSLQYHSEYKKLLTKKDIPESERKNSEVKYTNALKDYEEYKNLYDNNNETIEYNNTDDINLNLIYDETIIKLFNIKDKTYIYEFDGKEYEQKFSDLCIVNNIDSYILRHDLCLTDKKPNIMTGGNDNNYSSISTSSLC